jgi:acetyl-CoA C-acetyltransferase
MARRAGDYADLLVPELGAIALKAVVEKVKLDPAKIDEVIVGNIFGQDWGNVARHCVLLAGFPESVPAHTIDRQCASSVNALGLCASMIQTGQADIMIAGGVESYSQMPHFIRPPSTAYPMRLEVIPYKSSVPGGPGNNIPMIMTAENLAKKYSLTRQECDEFALASHNKAADAWNKGYFNDAVVPVTLPQKKGDPKIVKVDATVRFDATIESMARLAPVMVKDGVVTAANASPMNDGASAVLVMSEDKAKELGLEVLAVVKEFASAGCDPTIMGIGPVYATRNLMNRHGYKLNDFDLIELNEAFAPQSLACIKELGLDMNRCNVEGGAIAIGHPNGASGGMLVGRLVYALRRRSKKLGLISFCCGGGQGFSLLLENPKA